MSPYDRVIRPGGVTIGDLRTLSWDEIRAKQRGARPRNCPPRCAPTASTAVVHENGAPPPDPSLPPRLRGDKLGGEIQPKTIML